ncbi:leucine-rich repeat serine/threonine-protein kinase 1-like [Mya arenaria]|uniref:leucine-rich repeat serine/threonine-protein kinase 1-like n=1 Tax=Mya arenaria TaxID=6604 RepID=UPI0022E4F832|nr:leucine-rich repeat serine/threonine-protein kinase 1-like [Mya arenaria]
MMLEDEWKGQTLHQFAMFDRHDAMSDILLGEERMNINAPDRLGRTPVFTAVSNNSIKCLEVLLQHGADSSVATNEQLNKMTPLHQAVQDGKMDAVKLLLTYGADLSRPDMTGLSPNELVKSIGQRDLIDVFKAEDERRKQNAWNVIADLITACVTEDIEEVRDILRVPPPAGWDLANMSPDGDDRTALIVTAEKGNVTIMDELLGSVAELRQRPSVIHTAVLNGHAGIVRSIIKRHPECCRLADDNNDTPLHIACQTGSLEIVKLLLAWDYPPALYQSVLDSTNQIEYSLVVPVSSINSSDKTPLFLACENGHEEVVDFLLSYTVKGRKFEGNENLSENSSQDSHESEIIDFHPISVKSEHVVPVSNIGMESNESVMYKSVNPGDHKLSCIYIAVKNRHLHIVDKLVRAGASLELHGIEHDVKYNVLLKLALKNNDLLMINKLLENDAKDENNFVLKEAVKSKPNFVGHFLKYKASNDAQNNINKAHMKKTFHESCAKMEDSDKQVSDDQKYQQVFPKESVNIRWQNLGVLTTIEEEWLSTTVNFRNPALSNMNLRRQFGLYAITRVDVSHNNLTVVPIPLLQLPSLTSLTVSDNMIAEFPSPRNFDVNCNWLEEINIQNNRISTIPEYIFQLPKLRVINASNNDINTVPVSIWDTPQLKSIDLSDNKLKTLPRPILSFRTDSESTCGDGEDPDIHSSTDTQPGQSGTESHVIKHSLKRANHWTGGLTVNDEELKTSQMKGLITLKLNKNQLDRFPEFLSCCCNRLENLEMKRNRLKSLGNIAAYPKSLKVLDLSYNMIETMEDWKDEDKTRTCYFKEARGVDVSRSGNFIGLQPSGACCAHRAHTRLDYLEMLDFSHNKLEGLVVLRSNLTFEQSKNFADKETQEQEIQRQVLLPSLFSLNLNANRLMALPSDIKEMRALRSLYLNQNTKLNMLPPDLGLLDGLHHIEVQGCPLEGPIQDVIRGAHNRAADITGFLRSILEEAEEYNCMNMMLVGSFKIGKTSLLKHLMKKGRTMASLQHFTQREDSTQTGVTKDGDPLSTVGIDICQLIFDGKQGAVEFRTWDFAGQKEYYATHQYFLSQRSLYLVLWNLTEGEKGIKELKQWLVNIQAQARNSAVIIVGTHLDEITKSKHFPSSMEADMVKKIQEKYCRQDNEYSGLPNVIKIVNVASGKKTLNIDKLKSTIYDVVFRLNHPARKNEKLLGHKVPKKYLKLQHCIEHIAVRRMSEGKDPVLDEDSYIMMVMNEMSVVDDGINFRNKNDIHQASRFLHENGVICHFDDTALRDQYFLKPQWLCDQLARVVCNKLTGIENKGVMQKKQLVTIYRHSDRIGQYIISLLNKFEVALAIDDQNVLLPTLLPTHFEIVDPKILATVPIRRKGSPPNVSVNSVNSYPLPFQNQSTNQGEMSVANTKPDNNVVFSNTRLYLLTYFPSGFWPRLITKVLSDESFYDHVVNMFSIPQEIKDRCPQLQNTVPSWRCWQTGFELVYFDNVIMQVKEVQSCTDYGRGMCDYANDGLCMKCFFDNSWNPLDVEDSVLLEISFRADKLTFNFSFNESTASGNSNFQAIEQRDFYHDEKAKTGVLAKVVEHIDNLLQDWFPEIGESRFSQTCLGRYLVTRVIPCPSCLQQEVKHQSSDKGAWDVITQSATSSQPFSISNLNLEISVENGQVTDQKRVMCTFLVERCIKNVLEGMDEICDVHKSVSPLLMPNEDGVIREIHIAPDAVFHDLDVSLLIEDDALTVTDQLGRGAFGTVYAGKLRRRDHSIDVAIKVLYDPAKVDKMKNQQMPQISLETVCSAYTNARQEVSILDTVEHPHIVPLLGLSRRPLALILSRAPLGSLNQILEVRQRDGLCLPIWVIKQVVIQVVSALEYLHHRNIIYRDLKSDNVLAWHLPEPTNLSPTAPVLVKLADYGISKSVFPGGEARGFGGTPPFIAPEIIVHTGRDTYTEKVDIFSFGMFLFELLTCRHPLADVNNINMHVSNGGRPTLTTEEASLYPSHMLDLMTICWDHNPQNRPSATQVRQVAMTPQFCHLSDAVSMETMTTVLSACSVFVDNSSVQSLDAAAESSQIWLLSQPEHGSENHTIDILNFNTANKCSSKQELKHNASFLSVCTVGKTVWCLDSHGTILIYSPYTFDKLDTYQLVVCDIDNVCSMTFHPYPEGHDPGAGGHVMILVKECRQSTQAVTSLLSIEVTGLGMVNMSHDYQPIRIHRKCHCAILVQNSNSQNIWIGTDHGEILIQHLDHMDEIDQALVVSPNVDRGPKHLDCILVTMSDHASVFEPNVYTYNYPGNKIYLWNGTTNEKIGELDCSSVIPKLERGHLSKFPVNFAQVTDMLVHGRSLYVGTTWGCVIVADAQTLQPRSVFRCHSRDFLKTILPLGTANPFKRVENIPPEGKDSDGGIVTIGRGYIDVINHVMQLENQVVKHDTADEFGIFNSGSQRVEEGKGQLWNDCNTFVLAWDAKHWNYY